MTLFKAVEAARGAIYECRKMLLEAGFHKESGVNHSTTKALAALPAEPKSEDEIAKIISEAVIAAVTAFGRWESTDIVQALKAASCLYVKED